MAVQGKRGFIDKKKIISLKQEEQLGLNIIAERLGVSEPTIRAVYREHLSKKASIFVHRVRGAAIDCNSCYSSVKELVRITVVDKTQSYKLMLCPECIEVLRGLLTASSLKHSAIITED